MPLEDGDNRKPPRGLNLAERHVQKHLPDIPREDHVIPRTKPSEVI